MGPKAGLQAAEAQGQVCGEGRGYRQGRGALRLSHGRGLGSNLHILGHRVRVNGVSLLGLQRLFLGSTGLSLLGLQRFILGLPREKLYGTPNSLFIACLPPTRVPDEGWLGEKNHEK